MVNVIIGKRPAVTPTSGLRVCGRLGPGDDARVKAMAGTLGNLAAVLKHPQGTVWGNAPHVRETASGVAGWSAAPMPTADAPAAIDHGATPQDLCSFDPGTGVLQAGVSGAVPLYLDEVGAHFSNRLDALARTRSTPLRPDWTAWAHVIAAAGPLEGRTTFAGIRRLGPSARVTIDPEGELHVVTDGWPWPKIDSRSGARPDELRDALAEAVAAVAASGPVAPLLSGGWDSRVLATLAARSASGSTAWTTSSDTGHALEELVAAQAAAQLGFAHEIVSPRWDRFGDDLRHFARAVEHQTSFHVWAVPLADAVAGTGATVLDGLGGGIFVGGAFPDHGSTQPLVDQRFDRLTHYLDAADAVLHPNVTAHVRDRTRASFERVAAPLADHPFGAAFTAYLSRTLPGISLSPFALFADASPVAAPFLSDAVVHAALAIPREQHAAGRLYPELLRPLQPDLADMATAADLAPPHRRRKRRVSSADAAVAVRDLVTAEPVRGLLAPRLAEAGLETWRTLLDRTKSQHLIRGLAMLSLWLQRYAPDLEGPGPEILTERTG